MFEGSLQSELLARARMLYGDAASEITACVAEVAKVNATVTTAPLLDGPILLAYPGNIYGQDKAALQLLFERIKGWFPGAFETLHLLPFCPSSADFGFAPTDYTTVDPRFGDWSMLSELTKRVRLMADLVLHHTSSQHPWFKRFLRGDPHFSEFYIQVNDPSAYASASMGRQGSLITGFDTLCGRTNVMTRYGPGQIDLNYRSPKVLAAMIGNMARLFGNGVSVLRLDAIACSWKEPGSPCAHLEQTGHLLSIFRIAAAMLNPSAVLVPEIDFEEHESLYLNYSHGAPAVAYSYSFAPLLIEACLSGNVSRLADFLASNAFCHRGEKIIRFLSTHDGLFLRPYAPVLPDSAVQRLCEDASIVGGTHTRSPLGESVYEINVPVLDLLRGPEGRREDRARAALFILLSVPGIPLITLNSLLGAGPDVEAVARTKDPRTIVRAQLTASQADELMKYRQSHISAWLSLLTVRRQEETLRATAPARIHFAEGGMLAILRQFRRRRLLAVANVGKHAATLPLPFGGEA